MTHLSDQPTAFHPRPATEPTQWYPAPQPPRRRSRIWRVLLALCVLLLAAVLGGAAGGVTYLIAGETILPGVSALGQPLGGLTEPAAAATLNTAWDARRVTLTSDDGIWTVSPTVLGMVLDAPATAATAYDAARSPQPWLALPRSGVAALAVPPVWTYDAALARQALNELAPTLAIEPQNAAVRIAAGRAETVEPVDGRMLDVEATIAALSADPTAILLSGRLPLVVRPVPAVVVDVSAAVAEANRLLATTVTLRAHDPVSGETALLPVGPDAWGRWLSLTVDPVDGRSLRWLEDGRAAESFLDELAATTWGDGRYLDQTTTIAALQAAVMAQTPELPVRVYRAPRQHVVAAGETLSSIGRVYGIPYPWLQEANPGVDSLAVGQLLAIPSPDVMLPLPAVENKRIIVDLSDQRTFVYENGALLWEWPSSTGIDSSPTAPGIFQIQSHDPNAYASIWDLWMPSFMGIYRPVPSSDFMNGFHGFPTRGSSQLLWTGDLGRQVTYGCVLLSSENAQTLYEWAEAGVVVEVRP